MSERKIFNPGPWKEGLRKPFNWVIGALAVVSIFLIASQLYVAGELNSVIRTQDNYRQYDTVLKDFVLNQTNAETGQRGYLITQNTAYLAPYNQALPTIAHDLQTLDHSTLSKPYAAQIRKLKSLSDDKLRELKETIQAEQSQGQAAAYTIVSQGSGESDMNQIRQIVGQIHDAQSLVLVDQEAERTQSVGHLLLVTVLAVLCILALILQVVVLGHSTSRKEEQLDSMRQQFITIASHQLRTPATAIKQYLFLLLSDAYGKIQPAQRKVLGQIEASNERGIHIVNSLLDVNRLEAADFTIQAEPVDLRRLIKDLAYEYELTLAAKKQELKASLPETKVKALADPFYLRMAIENLLDNASKYSAEGKSIRLELTTQGEDAVISVQDEGIGIKDDDVPKLFNKFTRLPSANAASTQGSGLGLYIAKMIVALHAGKITVQSVPDKGTTFEIRLPMLHPKS
jgi:signal transduction histidine kinase